MQSIETTGNSIIIKDLRCFDLARSCVCGQSFRWQKTDNGWFGVVRGRGALVAQEGQTLTITPAADADIGMWTNYFDLYRDYQAIENEVAADAVLSPCLSYASGIHIFNQEPFETLISFIISANNNIKRISGIVERLCEAAGERCEGKLPYFSFPKPDSIAALSEAQLMALGSGYRAPYIKKSAEMIADGFDLEQLRKTNADDARRELLRFPGVGPKVADCILLFSLGHADAFPMDVWMKRAMRRLYFADAEPSKEELRRAISRLGPNSGILQQYIFHYARENM